MKSRYTIDQFRAQYPNDDACLHKLYELRFKGLICPKCESDNEFKRVAGRRSYQCPACGYQLYPTQGTVFEKTTTPLTYWFYAIYLQTTTRNGVAAKEIERLMPVCYTTALRMCHQIKKLMASTDEQLTGIVEIDEVYLGGKETNKTKAVRAANKPGKRKRKDKAVDLKIPVVGMLQRNGAIKTMVLAGRDKTQLHPVILDNVAPDATLVTDGYHPYKRVGMSYKEHVIINHAQDEWVKGEFHTNSIEGFWAIVRRTITGTHIHVSERHLQKYLDEIAFRYEHRHNQHIMFEEILKRVV